MTQRMSARWPLFCQGNIVNETSFSPKNLYRIGGISALMQLVAILASIVIAVALGPRPTSAAEFFAIQQTAPLAALLRGDFVLMFLLIGAYLGTFPALWWNLRRISPTAATFATLFAGIGVVLSFSGESTFALLRLGDLYAAASSEIVRDQLLAAGEAILAAGWWHSTSSYVTGILLQGGGVIISLVMLRSHDFSKVTAISGLLGNALDLIQHLLHPFAPSIAASIQMFMGVFYLVWFPMLARDFLRLARRI